MTDPKKPECKETYILVEIPPQTKSIYLLCKTNAYDIDSLENRDLLRFRYEENTATINIITETYEVSDIWNNKVLGAWTDPEEARKAFLVAECGEEEAEIMLEQEKQRRLGRPPSAGPRGL